MEIIVHVGADLVGSTDIIEIERLDKNNERQKREKAKTVLYVNTLYIVKLLFWLFYLNIKTFFLIH